MRRRFIHIFPVFFLALLHSISVFSQNIFLKGTVIDKSTGITIAMAHVRVGDIVTYTNAKGEFVLNIPSVLNENIEVFHMGYDTYFSEIQSEKPYLIALRPVEPTISSELTGVEIMTKVFSRLHLNYEIHDQFMLSYYRESLTDNDELHYIAEGIMELMIGSNMDDSPSLVRPIKTRVKTVNNIVHEGIDVKSGHATEMVESSIWHEKSFLREKNRWDYEYKLVGTEMHRNEHIFIIEFAPKNKDGYVAGRIYVDEYTYAIIRLEYTLFENLQFDTEVWIEEFQHHDLIYYLLRASFEGTWEENGEKYVFKSLIVNTEVESNRDASDLQDFYLGSSFTFPIQSRGEFTDEYWGDYNYIKLTEEEKAQLK